MKKNFPAMLKNLPISAALKLGLVLWCIFFVLLYIITTAPVEHLRTDLQDQLIAIGKTLMRTYQMRIEVAAENRDDIKLNDYMKHIMEFPRTKFSKVNDPAGKVIAHNDVKKWGKTDRDKDTLQILRARKFSVYRRWDENNHLMYEFIQPLRSSAGKYIGAHRIGFSAEGIAERVREMKRKSFNATLLWSSIFALIVGVFSKKITLYGAPKIKYILNTIMAERWDEEEKKQSHILKKKDEWGALARHCDYIAKRIEDEKRLYSEKVKKANEDLNCFIKNIGKGFKSGAILADSENKIVFINKTARRMLSLSEETEVIGEHITSLFKSLALIEIFQKSINNPNQLIQKSIENPPADITAVGIYSSSDSLIGVLVLLERRKKLRNHLSEENE